MAHSVPVERRRAVDGGQLIFVGNSGGKFFALDPASGKTLWESQLLPGGVATPISYELDGKQYIAVMAGIKGGRVYTFALDANEQSA